MSKIAKHTLRAGRLWLTTHRPIRPFTILPRLDYKISKLSEQKYHAISDSMLDSLSETFEALIEDSNRRDWDIECASGVLNLKLASDGTYVINKQPPNKQIWLSSPKSGPKRFDYDESSNQWFSTREGETVTLKSLLETELGSVFKTNLSLLEEID